jgi:wyosine [tRNA(Phe)-imidazoG37] synthetase (radical SAM superfamily)
VSRKHLPRPAPPSSEPPQDLRTRIANALAILGAFAKGQSGTVRRHTELATTTLEAAARGLADLEELIDVGSSVDLDTAKEIRSLRERLRESENARTKLEMRLAEQLARRDADDAVRREEAERVRALEKRSKQLDDVLANDPAAFDAFMRKELDKAPPPGSDRGRGRKG